MNLWLSTHLLVAGWFLCTSALTPEECQPLVTPMSLADPSVMYGRLNAIAGYTDHEVFHNILKLTESSWMKVSASPSGPGEASMTEENKIDGKCFSSSVNITIEGDVVKATMANITSVMHVLPSCEGCLVFSANSTAKDLGAFLQAMNISSAATDEEMTAHSIYLMAREATVKDSDLEHFKKQASCLGFTGDLDFIYDDDKGFCPEGQGIKI